MLDVLTVSLFGSLFALVFLVGLVVLIVCVVELFWLRYFVAFCLLLTRIIALMFGALFVLLTV